MPRYIVERTFHEGFPIPANEAGRQRILEIVQNDTENGVTWLQSYVREDKRKSYCLYEGPDPESIRRVAQRNGLPIDQIVSVLVLDPYYYQ